MTSAVRPSDLTFTIEQLPDGRGRSTVVNTAPGRRPSGDGVYQEAAAVGSFQDALASLTRHGLALLVPDATDRPLIESAQRPILSAAMQLAAPKFRRALAEAGADTQRHTFDGEQMLKATRAALAEGLGPSAMGNERVYKIAFFPGEASAHRSDLRPTGAPLDKDGGKLEVVEAMLRDALGDWAAARALAPEIADVLEAAADRTFPLAVGQRALVSLANVLDRSTPTGNKDLWGASYVREAGSDRLLLDLAGGPVVTIFAPSLVQAGTFDVEPLAVTAAILGHATGTRHEIGSRMVTGFAASLASSVDTDTQAVEVPAPQVAAYVAAHGFMFSALAFTSAKPRPGLGGELV